MLELYRRTRFDRDLRRMQSRGKKLKKLWDVVEILLNGISLPKKYKNHKLSGDLDGIWDCHVEPDWVMLYEITETQVTLIRTGTHADLFE